MILANYLLHRYRRYNSAILDDLLSVTTELHRLWKLECNENRWKYFGVTSTSFPFWRVLSHFTDIALQTSEGLWEAWTERQVQIIQRLLLLISVAQGFTKWKWRRRRHPEIFSAILITLQKRCNRNSTVHLKMFRVNARFRNDILAECQGYRYYCATIIYHNGLYRI